MAEAFFTKKSITLAAAQAICIEAVRRAEEMQVSSTVVVVDESGLLKAMVRMDGAPLVSLQLAEDKARTAAALGISTEQLLAAAGSDAELALGITGMPTVRPVSGGIPLTADGHVLGAVGVSGGSTREDIAVATAASQQLPHTSGGH